ncbi:MAG: L-threonylcarbamoyladenylate synthase [Gemmatimonadota bacterium]|nr:L-threonylcarbamoyladenylate synthase [Gemmatimonadota bacterium]
MTTEPRPRIVPADAAGIAEAAALLRAGELVAFPTETVYGLGGNALDPAAVARIYEAKGRPEYNPLIVHLADAAGARALATRWPEPAERLSRRWWPGPLTLVLPRAAGIPDIVTAGGGTVALRVPAHPAAQALLRAAGVPLAAPSANRSGEVSPTTAAHVARGLAGRIPLVLDGGATNVGIESTVLDLSGPMPVLLRPGMISRAELEREIGPVGTPGREPPREGPRPSPGMLERHYAPRAPLRLVPGAQDAVELARAVHARGERVGAVTLGDPLPDADDVIRLPPEPEGYARGLYGALHRLDELGVALILAVAPPVDARWDAVRDRLRRAAHPLP